MSHEGAHDMTARSYTTDAPRGRTRDASGPARRTLICAFAGTGFVAEREGDSLNVYLVTGDPIATGTSDTARSDASVSDQIAAIQARNEALYPRNRGFSK